MTQLSKDGEDKNYSPVALSADLLHALKRLNENGAVLALAENMDNGVIVRQNAPGTTLRSAVIERKIAEQLSQSGWITQITSGRICRFGISFNGRTALAKDMAQQENRLRGLRESQASFADGRQFPYEIAEKSRDDVSYLLSGPSSIKEPPVAMLARRKDKRGTPFISRKLLQASERLLEDYEIARLSSSLDMSLKALSTEFRPDLQSQSRESAAYLRLWSAYQALGPGLADVVHHCCCEQDGLETTEQKMGWSARSGKIVLRIALIRLHQYYSSLAPDNGQMIG